jgi:phosphatidylglycerophosphate synthase
MNGIPMATARLNHLFDRRRVLLGAALGVAVASAAAAVAAFALVRVGAGDAGLPARAVALAIAGGVLLATLVARELPGPSFGAANQVTLARGALTMLLLALLAAPRSAGLAWYVVAIALLGLALDGLDGWLARTRGEATAFGARFDMETDALLILSLSLLAWQLGKAGPWVVLAGALRYVFVAASFVAPWLGRALPPSRRRQAVCVVQIVSLIVCLLPVLPPAASAGIALFGLVALTASFATDVVWLARARG